MPMPTADARRSSPLGDSVRGACLFWGPMGTATRPRDRMLGGVQGGRPVPGLIRAGLSNATAGHQTGTAAWTLKTRTFSVEFEVRPNAVWRLGRVFLRCPKCGRGATRVYVPTDDSPATCRLCWGLNYSSRTLQNYKDSLWGSGRFARIFGTTQREWSFMATQERREERLERCRARWTERTNLLTRKKRSQSA
jgi:hypothetical protein